MIRKYADFFCWKNVSSFCNHIFSAKNIRILYIESAKTVNEMTLNELVKLTTLWTTGPWSLFYYGTLTTGNKMLWKRGDIAPKEQGLLFNTSLTSRVKLHIHLWKCACSIYFSSILLILFAEVQISRSISESSMDFEITRVNCISVFHFSVFICSVFDEMFCVFFSCHRFLEKTAFLWVRHFLGISIYM